MSDNNDKKVKLFEKISHKFKKKWLANGVQLGLIIAILFVAYYCLYLWLDSNYNIPEFDITINKIHTLSDTSKNVISKVDKDVEILAYGYAEDDTIFDLLKQYSKTNEHITYRRLTEENDLAYINNHNLSDGYLVVIIKCEDKETVIDASDFSTVDYTIEQEVDVTEQTITNKILAIVDDNKPKVYFTEGHNEYSGDSLTTINYFLNNENFEVDTVNLNISKTIPEDCNILVIVNPENDFSEGEVNLIKNYIANGGNVFYAIGVIEEDKDMANIQRILDEYGVTVENGFVLEFEANRGPDGYPFIFAPYVSETNKITADIYTDSGMTLVESARIVFKDDDTLNSLNVEKDILAYSSEESQFINDFSLLTDAELAAQAYTGRSDIAAAVEKKVGKTTNDSGEEVDKVSKLVICASSAFMTDMYSQYVSQQYPLSYMGANKDFVINSLAYLGGKDNTLTIRKDYAVNTYMPTDLQNRVVLTIIFSVPLFIMVTGFIVWRFRRKMR